MGNKYDYIIVGSGLYGATFAYKAKQAGYKVLVLERRSTIGGNIYCENIEGINVHKYGSHIFHTSNKEVWDFVNSFVEFNRYTNSPVANYKGELYNLPFNMNTFHQLWGVNTPEEAKAKIEEQRKESGITAPKNLEEQAISLVGRDIYEKLIKEYTEKQWGRKCTELPAFIIRRLPVRFIYDNNYFNDKYQGIPEGGYNKLVEGLLSLSPSLPSKAGEGSIEVKTEVDFHNSPYKDWKQYADNLVYTGAIDEFFDYKLGKLDWRTVSFKTRVEDTPNYQGNGVVNYTSAEVPYTRVIEHKHFEMFGQQVYDCPKTVISEEYSTEYKEGMEPYYPVNDDRNNDLVAQYKELAHKEGIIFSEDIKNSSSAEGLVDSSIIFGGRLAEYKYFDMHVVIESVLNYWKNKK